MCSSCCILTAGGLFKWLEISRLCSTVGAGARIWAGDVNWGGGVIWLRCMLRASAKRCSKPLGLACATFLSSWPGVLCQQLRFLCRTAARSVSSCAKNSLRFCAARQKSRQKWGFWCELSNNLGISLLSSHLISQGACTESCVYACRTLKTGDAAQPKGCSAGFVPI